MMQSPSSYDERTLTRRELLKARKAFLAEDRRTALRRVLLPVLPYLGSVAVLFALPQLPGVFAWLPLASVLGGLVLLIAYLHRSAHSARHNGLACPRCGGALSAARQAIRALVNDGQCPHCGQVIIQ